MCGKYDEYRKVAKSIKKYQKVSTGIRKGPYAACNSAVTQAESIVSLGKYHDLSQLPQTESREPKNA